MYAQYVSHFFHTHCSRSEPWYGEPSESSSYIPGKRVGRMSCNGLIPVAIVQKYSSKVLREVDPVQYYQRLC